MNYKKSTYDIAKGGLIAAVYVVVTMIAAAVGLSSGPIQFRFSEALCILPMFSSAAVPGLAVGCFLANVLTGSAAWDIVFGTLATLIGAIGTLVLRNHRWIAPLCPVVSNMIIVPFVLQKVYGSQDAYWFLFGTVGLGEFVCAYILGQILYSVIINHKIVQYLEDK